MSEKYDITIARGITGAKRRKVGSREKHSEGYWFYLGFVGQIGYTIAIPLVAGAYIGSLFNRAILGLCIGFALSVLGFIRIIKEVLKKR